MQKFKVISLSVGGKNNKICKSGDTVLASDFAAPIGELVAGGYLEPIKQEIETLELELEDPTDKLVEETTTVDEAEETENEMDKNDDESLDDDEALKQKLLAISASSINKPEIVGYLVRFGIPHDPSSKKGELFEALKNGLAE